MPIRVQCACGKTLAAPDAAAGRAVKCPGCGKVVQVPAGEASGKPTVKSAAGHPAAAQPTATQPTASQPTVNRPSTSRPVVTRPAAAASGGDGLDDLFDEEGFGKGVAAVCPACRKEIKPGAVLCTNCGYHTQQGVRIAAHETPGVDVSTGTLALRKAANDMAHEKKLQKDLTDGAGMPTWMLALILTILTGLAVIGVLAINFSRAAEESGTGNNFNAAQVFCLFGGICCFAVGIVAYLRVVWSAFKVEMSTGLLTAFVPFYIGYFAWQFRRQDKNLKTLITAVVILSISGAFFYGASAAR